MPLSLALRDTRAAYIWSELVLLQSLSWVIVIQWRGLNGSQGWLNAVFTWLCIFNAGVQWVLAVSNTISPDLLGAERFKQLERVELFARCLFTWSNCVTSGMSIITRALAPMCPEGFTITDLQFCNSVPDGLLSYDNLTFMVLMQQTHHFFLPVPFGYTAAGLAIGLVCLVIAVAIVFDSRYFVSAFLVLALYLLSCVYIIHREGLRRDGKESVGTWTPSNSSGTNSSGESDSPAGRASGSPGVLLAESRARFQRTHYDKDASLHEDGKTEFSGDVRVESGFVGRVSTPSPASASALALGSNETASVDTSIPPPPALPYPPQSSVACQRVPFSSPAAAAAAAAALGDDHNRPVETAEAYRRFYDEYDDYDRSESSRMADPVVQRSDSKISVLSELTFDYSDYERWTALNKGRPPPPFPSQPL